MAQRQKSLIEQILTDGFDSLFLLGCAGAAFLGILVNYIVALSVWGYLAAIYAHIMYGYIAGFIVTAIFLPLTLFAYRGVVINIKNGHNTSLRRFSLFFSMFLVFLTIAMLILAIFL